MSRCCCRRSSIDIVPGNPSRTWPPASPPRPGVVSWGRQASNGWPRLPMRRPRPTLASVSFTPRWRRWRRSLASTKRRSEDGRRVGLSMPIPSRRRAAEVRASEAALALGRRNDAREHLELASRGALNDQVLAIEILAQDAALRQFIEHRPDDSRSAADEAVAAARSLMPPGLRSGDRRWDVLDERVRRAVLRALSAGLQGAQFADDPEQMLRFVDELTVAATGFDDATRITALVDGALALRFQGQNVDAATRLRTAWAEVHRHVLPQSVLEVGAALASVALVDGPPRRSRHRRSRTSRPRHPARRIPLGAQLQPPPSSSRGALPRRLARRRRRATRLGGEGTRAALPPTRSSRASDRPRPARSGARRIRGT